MRLTSFSCRSLAAVALLLAFGFPSGAAVPLAKRHRDWLNGPVSYLITKPERQAFQLLSDEKSRDAFVERFWETRNPNPGTGQNEFKEEFYRRVAWANAHYGNNAGSDGWRTDMGKTYMLFGKPQTSMNYLANQELRPIELWFYSNPGLSELPPFFYVLFFEKDDVSGYHFYHPYVDGPDKLVRTTATKAQAYNMLREFSAELAQASLSLIPGEPVDTDTYSGSLASVVIMNGIQGYRDMPSYIAMISEKARRLEQVTSRIEFDVAQKSLVTLVAYDRGEPWLHWQLEIHDPLQPKARAGRMQFDVTARLYSNGRLVLERTDSPNFQVSETGQDALKSRPFLYEDRIPVVPGKYRLEVTARNLAAGRTYEISRDFSADAPADRALLSDILLVARHEPDGRDRPFQFGGVKFLPSASGQFQAVRGLNILYQVEAGRPAPASLDVEYVMGGLANRFRKTFEDHLDLGRADAFGSVITAKTLSIEELSPGAYQLALRVKDPQSGKISARSVAFTVTAGEEPQPIVISRGGAQTPQWLAANQYERALCWLAQEHPSEAVSALEASWNLSRNAATRGLLQHLYEQIGQPSRVRIFKQNNGSSTKENSR